MCTRIDFFLVEIDDFEPVTHTARAKVDFFFFSEIMKGKKYFIFRWQRNKKIDGDWVLLCTMKHARHDLNIRLSYFSPTLKFINFLYHPHGTFGIADPNSMQEACNNNSSKYDLNARHESLSSSMVWVSDRWTGGHGFDSCLCLRFFLCPMFVKNWIVHLSYCFPSLKFTIFPYLSIKLLCILKFYNDKTNGF